jgi:hypothetical protein
MLQQNLVAKQTGTAPSTDVANQTRFEEALQQMLASLKSNAQISTASANL